VRGVALGVALAGAILGTGGCFGVHNVSQGPWVIDDFEDGDLRPADRNLGAWTCYTYEPSNQDCRVGLGPGDQSDYSLVVDFTIVDPPDGASQQGGAEVQTETPATAESLLRFGEMVFGAKLVSGTPALPSITAVYVQLGCSTAQLENGETPGNAYVLQEFTITADWQPFSLPVSNFASPYFDSNHLQGGPAACLERVDSVMFSVDPQLGDGQMAMGRLSVDDIYFQ
jgi:hypothetical protein